MALRSIEYGTFELVYEVPMSAVSGGVGLGAGVGRGREAGTAPFAATAPMVKMRTANAALDACSLRLAVRASKHIELFLLFLKLASSGECP